MPKSLVKGVGCPVVGGLGDLGLMAVERIVIIWLLEVDDSIFG
jgi:hypothetical protein